MSRQTALECLYKASDLVTRGDYSTNRIAALLATYSPIPIFPSHLYYFTGPLLLLNSHTYSPFSILPAWLVQQVHLRRLDLIIAETQNEFVGDLATAADIMAFFFLLNEAGDLPLEWRPLYMRAVREAAKPGFVMYQEEGDGLRLQKNIRAEIERLALRSAIASAPWYYDRPGGFSPDSSSQDISLQQLGLLHLKPEGEGRAVTSWAHW